MARRWFGRSRASLHYAGRRTPFLRRASLGDRPCRLCRRARRCSDARNPGHSWDLGRETRPLCARYTGVACRRALDARFSGLGRHSGKDQPLAVPLLNAGRRWRTLPRLEGLEVAASVATRAR